MERLDFAGAILEPPTLYTFDDAVGAQKIVLQLGCQRSEIALEFEGKNLVRITTDERGGEVHEVLMPEDVQLKRTTAAFDSGALTVTVPKRAGSFAGCAPLWRRLKKKMNIPFAPI